MISRSSAAPEVFAEIFDRHFAAVHRYLARRVGRERADDLASQTFAVAFERRASFRPNAIGARPWLFGIATNLLSNDRRSEQRLLEAVARLNAERKPPVVNGAGREGLDVDGDVAVALASLDVAQRDVLLLHAWAELTYEEIADSLGIPLGTVRSRLSRARGHLRSKLPVRTTAATHVDAERRQEAP